MTDHQATTTAAAPHPPGHMIVCGGDALTHRLALELIHLYRERVTLVIPEPDRGHGPQLAALATADGSVTVITGRSPDEPTLLAAGIADATALALTMDDDPAVTQAALLARGLNPRLRLVIRIFGSRLGQRLENLLDRAADQLDPSSGGSSTVLSASETVAPALVSAAVTDRHQLIPVNGGTFSVVETPTASPDQGDDQDSDGGDAVPLALLAPRTGGRVGSGDNPVHVLLPAADAAAAAGPGTTRAVLRLRHDPDPPALPGPRLRRLPLRAVFSRRVRRAALGLSGFVAAITLATWLATGQSLLYSLYQVLMDVAAAGNPAEGAPLARQLLQVLSVFAGMLIMPLVLALVLESLGALHNISALDRPRRSLGDHIVIIGLGKVGSRVMERLAEMRVPVVAVERDPAAPGVARARALRVPVVIGDISQSEVHRAARINRCRTLMALTSNDSVNLEAVLYAREQRPDLRVVLRLFDDAFASTVYRALNASYPQAPTRSRSVSYLAAPAFAAAMMGRQVLAAIPVERQMLLVATIEVRHRVALAGRTVGEAFRAGGWRVVGLRSEDGSFRWNPAPDRQLTDDDRVVVVATREGLGLLLRRDAVAAAEGAGGAGGTGGTGGEDPAEEGAGGDGRAVEEAGGGSGSGDGAAAGPGPGPGPGSGAAPEPGSAPGPAPGAEPSPGGGQGQRPGGIPRPAPEPLGAAPAGSGAGAVPGRADGDGAPGALPRLPRAQPSPPYPDQADHRS
ncbi:NAD-binding protein [Streptacidiphilus cavernicola]|uniref:NAD-binding protein n=1 Tax=Streptacidiphilus cavernicola TaxID=3342716 RepID=A0ABV6W2P1_9ACTN